MNLNIESLINDAWTLTQKKALRQEVSCEKSVVFLFCLSLYEVNENKLNLEFDFESQVYFNFEGSSKFLDLMIKINGNIKIGFEFKFPQKTKSSNSNRTQTRYSSYRDISRLYYLTQENIIDEGYFLFATNESAYLNSNNIKKHKDFLLTEGYKFTPIKNKTYEGLSLPCFSIHFKWDNIYFENNKYKTSSIAWLKPIKIKY